LLHSDKRQRGITHYREIDMDKEVDKRVVDAWPQLATLVESLEEIIDNSCGVYVVAVDDESRCCFLSKADFTCAIYEHRPNVCRRFGECGETHRYLQCSHLNKARKKRI
jgi:Fe-S-cluster containining protein